MVKIINTLGDVKVGKQGTAIYQRQYGQQIRSVTSVMRGIPSQEQLVHRQLYRDALAWRKALSLPNRRYLEGYCIFNGIIDKFGIPLAWSRFALKLYLQHVAFVMIKKSTLAYFWIPDTATEEQTQWSSSLILCGLGRQRAGQFLTIPNRNVSKLAFDLQRQGSPTGDVIFTIRKVSDDSIIVSKVWGDAADLLTSWNWIEVEFDEPTNVNGDVRILCEFYDGDYSNGVNMRFNTSNVKSAEFFTRFESSVYTNKTTWEGTYKYTYELETGEQGGIDWDNSVLGLLHVRHPALLTVVHKRGELTIIAYDTLSSLDEEYLTGQVGLDVFTGDVIEVTTLTGLAYHFKV